MIVSLLQLMGFPMGKPVHSRAGETPSDKAQKAENGTRSTKDQVQPSAARRQEVKAKTGKDTKAKKPEAKAPAKVVAKPVAKPAGKKAAPKAVEKKPQPVTKGSPVLAKATEKKPAAAKPVTKSVVKSAEKPQAKKPIASATKPAPAKAPGKFAAPVAATPKEKVPSTMSAPVPKAAPVPVAPPVAASTSTVPQKAGRPSSRLAQLTVPSMAQSVASTAAKASYSQSIPSPVIVPALPSSIKKDPKLANNWKTKPVAELTDAELMAMPDSEYMNDVQMAAFRLKLSILKRDILSNAGETTEHLREDTSVVPDPADRATIEEEHALELRTRDRERKLLKKIEQSIVRIDAGDYGYCDETGEAIGVGRLLARPTATLSLEAQQRRELKQKMFGD
jgi:DnaK suppressor protein